MCFSAPASFVGAGVVGAVGIATLTQVRERRELPYALLPLAFAGHQLLEGLTWLELDGRPGASLDSVAVRLWVLYAWALLPLWLPLSVRSLEPDERRRRWLVPFLVVGAGTFLVLLWAATRPELEVVNVGGNLDYVMPLEDPILLAAPYVLCTCIAPMLSSYRWVQIFGVANLGAVGISGVVEARDFSSIWCTLAAFLSCLILAHFWTQRRGEAAPVGGVGSGPLPGAAPV